MIIAIFHSHISIIAIFLLLPLAIAETQVEQFSAAKGLQNRNYHVFLVDLLIRERQGFGFPDPFLQHTQKNSGLKDVVFIVPCENVALLLMVLLRILIQLVMILYAGFTTRHEHELNHKSEKLTNLGGLWFISLKAK